MKKFLFLCIAFFISFPVVQANFSLSPLKFEYDMSSFSPIEGTIKVINSGDESITLYSTQEDFTAGDDSGAPKFIRSEEQTNPGMSLSNWISVEDKNITLAPKETREVKFTIQVPTNAEPGGHYAAIFFSPGMSQGAQVAIVQRLGVLLLVNVPGEVKIDGQLKNFNIGEIKDEAFIEKTNFTQLPITFQTVFQNNGNIHLKPSGKITLIDENGNILKNVGKQSLLSPSGVYLGESLVDYIPVNDSFGNVLPKSERKFDNIWEGIGYTILNDDGTKSVKFKDLSTYYKDSATAQAQYLMFWQAIHTKEVEKKFTAKYELTFSAKDKEQREFLDEKDFFVTYEEQYIGLNYIMILLFILIVGGTGYYFVQIRPLQQKQKEEMMRKKIIDEINQNK